MHHFAAANRHGRASRYRQINDSSADAFSLKAGYAPGLPTPAVSPSALRHVITSLEDVQQTASTFKPSQVPWREARRMTISHRFCGHSNTHIDSCSRRRAGNKQVRYPIDGRAINLSTACQRDNYRTLASYVGSSTYYITNFLYTLGPIRQLWRPNLPFTLGSREVVNLIYLALPLFPAWGCMQTWLMCQSNQKKGLTSEQAFEIISGFGKRQWRCKLSRAQCNLGNNIKSPQFSCRSKDHLA